ncbi:MAG: restriction endonuclease, SacI family [Caldilineaceae bacterium]|nr:restriction endonuclease, SacI family [Caldilineaceae bacterium]
MILTCTLAKIHNPDVDIRKPYTEIGTSDSFSGRAEYDEKYVGPFAAQYNLPVNLTTAFLTPGFRTINVPLALPLTISGRPKRMYIDTIDLLGYVHSGQLAPQELMDEAIRQLLILKQEQDERRKQLLENLRTSSNGIPLSAEEIVTLISQHLRSPRSSRLPVLVVAAAYHCAASQLGETLRPLFAHNAANLQTGALGDIEITLVNDEEIVTCYEMKAKEVTRSDIDAAIAKLSSTQTRIDNYIFITTGQIDSDVADYAVSLYRATDGIEFIILDCIGFLRHFLHLFHRLRIEFLDAYQSLVLNEPDSAVNQPLKELFLTLRQAAEVDSGN